MGPRPTPTGGGTSLEFQATGTYLPPLKRAEVIKFFYSRKILSEPMRCNEA